MDEFTRYHKTIDRVNEAIAALKPDIVFTSGMSSAGGTSPFQSVIDSGICVADIPSPDSIEGISEDLKFIGCCVGKGAEALAYAKGLTVNPSANLIKRLFSS